MSGFSSIVSEGTYEGTVLEVPAYTLSTSLSDENAGVVTANPSLEKYDEGSEITLSATENFSYHFQGWENNAGEIVSTANPYKFTIGDNTSLKAVYSKNNAYILDLNISDNANSNLVDISPVGTSINGKRYYEEGTEVMLTAINNPILTFTHWDDNSTSTQ